MLDYTINISENSTFLLKLLHINVIIMEKFYLKQHIDDNFCN